MVDHDGSELTEKTTGTPLRTFAILCFVIVAMLFLGGMVIYNLIDNWSDRASFGDMFGAINALFAGLAFAGVIYAILLQRRELELQRLELKLTRDELRRSAQAQEKSEQALAEQAKALLLTAKLNTLSFVPALTCAIEVNDAGTTLTVSNVGSVTAFDVDIVLVGAYLDSAEYLDELMNEDFLFMLHRPQADSDGNFGIFDHLYYPVFPLRRRVVAELGFPRRPDFIHLLIQFRDLQGSNYHQHHWFAGESLPSGYSLAALDPRVPANYARITHIGPREKARTEDGTAIPGYIERELLSYCDNSASASGMRMLKVENRGTWSDA